MNIIRERCLLFWSLAGLLAGTGIYLGSRAALGICAGLLLFLLLSTVSARRMAGKTSLKAETAENNKSEEQPKEASPSKPKSKPKKSSKA